jgi:tight adherence protein B
MTLVVPALLGFVCASSVIIAVLAWRGFALPAWASPGRVGAPRLVTVQVLGPVLVALVVLIVTRWPVAAAIAGLGAAVLPRVFAGRAARRARLARIEALATWAEQLRDTLAGAAGLEETIQATVRVAPLPLRSELARLARRLDRNKLVSSLRAFADELADPLADLIVSALILGAEKEVKDLGALLGALADTARDEAAMHLRVDAGRARTRSAVQIITVFTVVFATGMVALNRRYLAPFDSLTGQGMLLLVGGCFAAAFWTMDRMSRAPETDRVLVADLEKAAR